MRFRTKPSTHWKPSFLLVYRPEEYSFDVEPAPGGGFTSILVDDLNLEVDELGRVISVWGLCPHTRWVEAKLAPPEADFGDVFVSDVQLSRGVSIRLNHNKYLPVHVDPESGWVRIRGEGIAAASSVKLLPGVIFEITEQGQFCSLWLMSRRAMQTPEAGSILGKLSTRD